jgi:predicted permease
MRKILFTLRNLFRKKSVESELQEELRFHLDSQIRQNLEKGMSEEEARREAKLQLGGLEQTKEKVREIRSGHFVETLFQDIRHAFRLLVREPGFLAVALLTLSIGIGANTAIFSVAQAVLMRPLPYPNPDRLVMLWSVEKDGSLSNVNYATFEDWKHWLKSFSSISVMSSWEPTLSGYGDPVPLEGMGVTHDFLKVLGVSPMLGRDFLEAEDHPDRNREVILSYRLWKIRFQQDRSIIGKQIMLNGIPRTVVGVMSPAFQPLIAYNFKETEIYRPLGYDQTLPYACRSCNHLQAIARIRDGISLEQANAETDVFTKGLIKKYPDDYGSIGSSLVPLHEQFVSRVRTVLLLLLVAVATVLLISCSNLAGLMLSRSLHRSSEFAIRAALGAGRMRLVRQLITESMLLALTGGVLGVILAQLMTRLLIAFAPMEIPRLDRVSMDAPVLFFAFGISFVCGILFGFLPALRHSDVNLQEISFASRRVTGGEQKLRRVFVASNIAIALVLLAATGLLIQSVKSLLAQKLGFDPEKTVSMTISLTGPKYDDENQMHSFYRELLEKLHSLTGIESSAIVNQLPMSTNLDNYGILVADKPVEHEGLAPSAQHFVVSDDYFRTMQIPLFRGRLFTASDRSGTLPVVIVNRTFAKKIWPQEDPIGKQIHIGEKERPWMTVVGVVEDVRHISLQEPFAMQFYMPYEQAWDSSFSLVLRTNHDFSTAVAEVRRVIQSIDRAQAVFEVVPMQSVINKSIGQRTFALRLLELFALVALLLASMGVYGVMAYSIKRRYQEIGIRSALGATRRDVLLLFIGSGFKLAFVGIGTGLVCALIATNFLQSLLFGLRAYDPPTLIVVSLILFGAAAIACIVPAYRATRLNPVLALRYE